MSEDKHLLKLLRHGDSNALRRLYEKYRTDLFTVALSLIHDVHAAEDCLQDVFVRLAEGAADMEIRRNLKGYLVSSVANRARDQLRKKTKLLDRTENIGCSASAINPVKVLIDREESARVFDTLMKLPYDQREVFVLRVQAGMKFKEIAKLQNISTRTVISRYRYGIEKLKVLLERDGAK
ncbi:MAG: sigma-70 family RNA polymerase sigma factor [Planctomycetes bacterium]|nr:sigma-70 family RNA polymerase sigma factor [Planctomycetota bacterium]